MIPSKEPYLGTWTLGGPEEPQEPWKVAGGAQASMSPSNQQSVLQDSRVKGFRGSITLKGLRVKGFDA